jgi:hypothetical protein
MSEVAFNSDCTPSRTYSFRLPVHVPFFGIGTVMARLKHIGVWDELPPPLRKKIKLASRDWSNLKVTKEDLDSIPDETWNALASALRLK